MRFFFFEKSEGHSQKVLLSSVAPNSLRRIAASLKMRPCKEHTDTLTQHMFHKILASNIFSKNSLWTIHNF